MISRSKVFWFFIIVMPVFFSACDSRIEKPDYNQVLNDNLNAADKARLASDLTVIDDSLELWDIQNVQIDPKGGVRYVVMTQGTGAKASSLETQMLIKFRNRLVKDGLQGTIVDESDNFHLVLYNTFLGWQTTLPLLPQGSVVKLFVPSGLGYGSQDIYDAQREHIVIPKNSNLIFEIEILQVY